ncbi:hypothetical protein [Methylobacterium brachiatum]|uniref:hypothetical protein n=1 Tax=Methylobacterium brachiatum TaxID=269660 RepID=UPI0008EB8F4C|nr:hypothetical protein [Methylobacterium brachiatum]SFI85211.1 hypothetical protein SAMN02799642_02912 [Methylobacterium brachiatum]
MIRALKSLFGLAQREDATTGELAPSLPAAEAELAAAQAAQTAAEEAYRGALLTADEAGLLQLDAARREAGVRIDRATALIDALRARLADAQAREAEAARVMRFQEASREADDAAAALGELYPKLAGDLVALLMVVARADQLVQAANADRPEGTEAIPGVERRVRSRPGSPEEVLDEVRVERWVQVGQIRPGSFDQDEVYATGNGRGRIPVRGLPISEGHEVELRWFTEQYFFPADHGAAPEGLAERLVLPGFRQGDADFFQPVERPYQGTVQPRDVLSRIAKLRAKAPRGAPQQAVEGRLVPANVEPVQALPPPESHREYRGRYSADETTGA